MTVDPSGLRVGPDGATVRETTARGEDVNGDGLVDQVVHVPTRDLGLDSDATQLCLDGVLSNGRTIFSCNAVRVR